MGDDGGTRDVVAGAQVVEQANQAVDLRRRERLRPVVVELAADRGGVDVGARAPASWTGVQGAVLVNDQRSDGAVYGDDVGRTHWTVEVCLTRGLEACENQILTVCVDKAR